MKLSFYGGARAVTGSCFLLETEEQTILIDCGIQQACDEFNSNNLEFYASHVDQVLVTSPHVDSTGRLPLLVQEGYYGRIVTTEASKKIMSILLKETADTHMNDALWRNQKGQRGGSSPVDAMFSMRDVVSTLQQVETEAFYEKFFVCAGVEGRFLPSGHCPGSATLELWVTENEKTEKIVFSGDLANNLNPVNGVPTFVEEADYVVVEATNGDRVNPPPRPLVELERFAEAVDMTLARSGNVIIPANVVGRLQEVLYIFSVIKKEKLIKSVPNFQVYVDSFLAEDAVRIFEGETGKIGDFDLADYQGEKNGLLFDGLKFCTSIEESQALNYDKTPKVIIAGEGTCNRGRMKHHLKHNLWRKESTVMMLSFMGEGSLAQRLVDGLRSVRLFGEEIMVKANILDFSPMAAHADQNQLLFWMQQIKTKPKHCFVVHGSEKATLEFADILTGCGFSAHAPKALEVYDLTKDEIIKEGINPEERALSIRGRTTSMPFIHLQDNVRELDAMVRDGRWHTGEEFDAMSRAVQDIMETWQKRLETPKLKFQDEEI